MDDELFPKVLEDLYDLEDDLEEDDSEEIVGYKEAPYFDSQLGDFRIDGHGRIITADGVTAWSQWCENILATDRYNHESYTDDIGIDYEEIFQTAETQEEAETLLETEITEALLCDPYGRTKYVQGIEFDWTGPDEVTVNIEVVGMDNELITISKDLSLSAT